MKNQTASPIKPIKKNKTCPNCGVPKGNELLCPVCHSIGGLYLFEWIILITILLIIIFVALIIIVLVHR